MEASRDERRRVLEEVVRLLESVKTDQANWVDFDDGRVDSHVTTALSSARAALSVLSRRESPAETPPET